MDMATALAEMGAIGTSIDAETRDRRYQEPQRPAPPRAAPPTSPAAAGMQQLDQKKYARPETLTRLSPAALHPGRLGAQ